MAERFDVLVIGAGLFGATCAYELGRHGLRCLVLEKRGHIGGNCYSEDRDGIQVHVYGPHFFHTSDDGIWRWVRRLTDFNSFRYRGRVSYQGKLYSFPLNLTTFEQLWGVGSEEEARARLERERISLRDPQSLEDLALSRFGRDLYAMFVEGYTKKQWGRPPGELPASILKRIPLRFARDDSYFDDRYQGIPIAGYTAIFEKLLKRAVLRLNTDYFQARSDFDALARTLVYTGPIDRFFDYRFGKLEYRSLRFEHTRLDIPKFQETAVVNFTEERIPYTRLIEHKHFGAPDDHPVTWITHEYPEPTGGDREPMYPIRDAKNCKILEQYTSLERGTDPHKVYFGGRLAEYRYYDMHQVIASGLKTVERILADFGMRRCDET